VAVLLFDEVELLDVAGVLSVLGAAGRQWNYRPFKLVPVATRTGFVDTRSQLRIEARTALADCPSPELVVVPGGYGARRALGDPDIVQYLERVAPTVTQFFGVGNGVLLLGRAGIIADLDVAVPAEATASLAEVSPSARPDVSARFRESGKVISASTAAGAIDGALHLVSKILGKKQAETVAVSLGLAWAAGSTVDVSIVQANE
jgi:transcriptional regulator GlxA family with amidase domain